MPPLKRLLPAFIIATFCVGLLVFTATFLLPRLLEMDTWKERISRGICRTVHCEISYENLEVSLWPTPRATIRNGAFQHAENLSLSWEEMLLVLRLPSLLQGRLEVSRVIVQAPQLDASLPAVSDSTPSPPVDAPSFDVPMRIADAFSALPQLPPSFRATLKNGSMKLTARNGVAFHFSNIQADLRSSRTRYDIDLECDSNLADGISLHGFARPDLRELQLSGGMAKARVHLLQDLIPSPFPWAIGDSLVNVEVNLQSRGSDTVDGTVKASSPRFKLVKKDRELDLMKSRLEAQFHLEPERIEVVLSSLHFEEPQSTFQGTYAWDAAQKEALLHIQGKDLEAAPVREAALFLWESHSVVKRIFEIVLEGRVPLITFDSKADRPGHLGRTQNFVLEGEMHRGTILVPNAQLLAREAYGKARVENGVLECSGLRGKTTGSSGENGHLLISLRGNPEPFHLQIDLDADLSEVKPVLERVVRHEAFQRELALFKDVQGRGRGKLVLGESLDHVETLVDMNSYRITSDYARLPFPFTAEGSKFVLQGNSITADIFSGSMGRTSLTQISARVNWEEATRLELSLSGPSSVELDELYPWLLAHDTIQRHMTNFQSFKGTLALHTLQFQGPALQPENWEFTVEGETTRFAMECSFLPSVLTVGKGAFEATHNKLLVRDAQSRLLDAAAGMNASFHDYTRGLSAVELEIAGSIGEQATRFIMEFTEMPQELKVRGPCTLQRSRVFWNDKRRVTFDGDISWDRATKASLKLDRTAEFLSIDKITIKDKDSDAKASIIVDDIRVGIDFQGRLQHTTLDRLLVDNQLLEGTVDGSLKAQVHLDNPVQSSFQGNLALTGFQYLWGLQSPAYIERADFQASKNRLQFTEALVRWQDNYFEGRGEIVLGQPHVEVDLDMRAGKIDWSRVTDFVEEEDLESESDGHLRVGDATVVGIIRLKADEFTRDAFTMTALDTDIHLETTGIRLDIKEAVYCTMRIRGTLRPFPKEYELELDVSALNADLANAARCLWESDDLVTGTYEVKGRLEATSPPSTLFGSLVGKMDFKARDGRINRFTMLSRIFSVVNITEFYRGHFPDWSKEGTSYNTMEGTLHLDGPIVRVDEFILDGPYIKMVVKGDVNIVSRRMDLVVLVSPLRTADRVINMVPLLGNIMGGSLILIPVEVHGDMDNPTIIPLSPGAVGSELLGYLRRIFKAPLRLIQPGS